MIELLGCRMPNANSASFKCGRMKWKLIAVGDSISICLALSVVCYPSELLHRANDLDPEDPVLAASRSAR